MCSNLNSSIHKRMPGKDHTTFSIDDDLDGDAAAAGKQSQKKLWRKSLPHACVAIITSFLFGYHSGIINEPLDDIAHDLGFSGNTLEEGLMVSICLGGAFVGCMMSGWIANEIGRRRTFQLSAFPMIIGPCVSAVTETLGGMLLGRFIVGIGMGLGPPVAALYLSEISPSSVRGTYGSFTQLATCIGLLGALLLGIPVKMVQGWWRVCFWISCIPAILLVICMQFCAESPYWLIKKGRNIEAEAEFERLLEGSHVKSAIEELPRFDKEDETESVRFMELLCGRHSKVIFIGSMLFTFQQLSGINAIFYFSATVFKSVGVPTNTANVCVGLSNLLGSVAAILLMDKLGRKLLLFGSFIVMAIAMAFQAASWNISNLNGSDPSYLSIVGLLMFVLAFALGAGPVPGLLLAEIFPNKIREKAMAFCMCVNLVENFFVGLLFLQLLKKLGSLQLYSILSFICMIAALFVKKNVIETKGKSLHEIETLLLPPE